jgi:hypothetical protein
MNPIASTSSHSTAATSQRRQAKCGEVEQTGKCLENRHLATFRDRQSRQSNVTHVTSRCKIILLPIRAARIPNNLSDDVHIDSISVCVSVQIGCHSATPDSFSPPELSTVQHSTHHSSHSCPKRGLRSQCVSFRLIGFAGTDNRSSPSARSRMDVQCRSTHQSNEKRIVKKSDHLHPVHHVPLDRNMSWTDQFSTKSTDGDKIAGPTQTFFKNCIL